MFDSKSDYAQNKLDKDAIVYSSATGIRIRLTREDFASEEEFLYWKRESDKDYHMREKAEHIQANHSISLESLPEKVAATHSSETEMIEQQEREQLRQLLLAGLDNCLTVTQRRRLWLYCAKGWTAESIALSENVTQQSVSECIAAARKKIFELLEKCTL